MKSFNIKAVLCIFVSFTFMLTGCKGDEDMENIPNIPLENLNGEFRRYLLEYFDKDKDGEISQIEADAVTEMDCSGISGLNSLDGIQHFKNLKVFRFSNARYYNPLDLSGNTKLEELYCDFSSITSIDLSKNIALRILDCHRNNITSLVLPESSTLETLYCQDNTELTSLDLTKYTALKNLNCIGTNIGRLDLNSCKELKTLFCSMDFKDVTFAEGIKLDELSIGGKALNIRTLNVAKLYCPDAISIVASENANLKEIVASLSLSSLIADGSGLESFSYEVMTTSLTLLDLKNCKNLKSLNIKVYDRYGKRGEAKIDLDVSGCTALETMTINYTNSLNATGCTALKYVDCYGMISKATFDGCSALENLIFSDWALLKSLDVSDCKALKTLMCDGTFTNLDLSANISLDSLECRAPITGIDIKNLTKLRYLNLNIADLSSLDARDNNSLEELSLFRYGGESYVECDVNVSSSKSLKKIGLGYSNDMYNGSIKLLNAENCTSLESIEIKESFVESLNIKNCSSLKTFSIINSYTLSSLDFSDLASLDSIYVEHTGIQSIKVNKNIRVLDTRHNQYLSSLDVSGCEKLEKLISINGALNSLELNECTSLETLECSGNNISSLDVSPCTKLVTLNCSSNNIASLDISNCTKLVSFSCQDNKLTGSLDASKCKALTDLACKGNADLAKLILHKNYTIAWLSKDAHTVLELVD